MIFFVYIRSAFYNYFNVLMQIVRKHHPKTKYKEPIVTTRTRRLLLKAGYHPQKRSFGKYRHLKYRKKSEIKKKGSQSIRVSVDYACLQYMGIVRHYIQTKYDLTIKDLELLLFLHPLQIISKKDYRDFPHRYNTRTLSSMLNVGVLEPVFDDKPRLSKFQVYKMSLKHRSIVQEFYQYLHQEKPMPELAKYSRLFAKQLSYDETVKAKAITRLNKKTTGATEDSPAFKRMEADRKRKKKERSEEKWQELHERADKETRKHKIKQIMEEEAEKKRLGKK